MHGYINGYFDVAQVTLYAFWIFFAGLIYYLRTEDKREGYPLKSDRSPHITVQGFPPIPKPKAFVLSHGETVYAPRVEAPEAPPKARPADGFPGAPLVPTGNPLIDAVGPAAYANRQDVPDLTFDTHEPKIVPLRADPAFYLPADDLDPRGMKVLGADDKLAGVVTEVWVDRSEYIIRYLEVGIKVGDGARLVLLPMTMLKIDTTFGKIRVRAITAAQFADVPGLKNPNQVTLLEEDKIVAYYGGGTLYATAARSEPLI